LEGFPDSRTRTIIAGRNGKLGGAATPNFQEGIQRVVGAFAKDNPVEAGSLTLDHHRTATCVPHARDAGRG
jgi:hypothetical protein